MTAPERAELDKLLAKETPSFRDEKFPAQLAYLEDVCPLICVLCTRRAGKSFGAALRLLRACTKHAGASCLFIALTRDSAKKILWKDCLKVINRRWKLGIKFNETELSATLPNGSVIYLLGVDTNEDEKEKLLGQKYAEVVIDEGASYSIDLNQLVYGVLKPAVADYRGTISIVGTPGNLKSGLFFELTKGQDPGEAGRWTSAGWSGHRWSALDNPYMREKWLAEIADLIRDNPRIEETPLFQQHYRGRWVIDDSKLVYRYLPERNDYDGTLPLRSEAGVALNPGGWHYVLAMDLGFTDATSFTVCAYHDELRTLFFVCSYKKAEIDITAKAEQADGLKAKYPIEQVVIDGANKDAVEELNNRHQLGAEPADKTGKADFIDIMNAEFIQGRVKLSPACEELKEELNNLIWDERQLLKSKRVEHPGCQNHCTDGALYGWRFCWQYLSVEQKPKPQRNTAAYFAEQSAAAQREVDEAFEAQFERNRQQQAEERESEEWL